MRSTHAWRRALAALLLVFTFAASVSLSPLPVLAGTTGVITGTVTDSAGGAPIAGVAITAQAPTGRYQTKTDAKGFYAIAGVYSDTYTVTFQIAGYEPQSIAGVSVFADETARVDIKLAKSLKTIAKVTARSQASAYQPTQTNNTVTVNAAGIENFQGSTFNTSETNLVASLPGANIDASGFPIIHGGRDAEVGWEFEGIPYVDAYSNQFTNNLTLPGAGVSSIQITAGPGSASTATNGTGSFNLVAKRGTYPGYSNIGASFQGVGFGHSVTFENSFATQDGRFSNYASFYGSNIAPKTGTGDQPLALIGQYNAERLETHREFIDNFIFRFGHNNDQSIQLFADLAQNNLFYGAGGLDGICFATCDPGYTGTWGGIFGLTTAQVQELSPLYPYQTSSNETLSGAGRAPATQYQPNQAFKIEYTRNLNATTYASLRFYRVNSSAIFDYPATEGSYGGDSYVTQGGQTTGAALSLTKQLGTMHSLQIGADFHRLHPNDLFQSDYLSFLGFLFGTPDQQLLPYAFIRNNDPDGCPLGAGLCGWAYQANPSAAQLTLPQFYQIAQVDQQVFSVYANDKITFNDRLNAEVGLRLDGVNNQNMPPVGLDPTYCTTQYLPATWTANPNYNAGAPFGNGNCPFNATFNVTDQMTRPRVLEPRLGVTYTMKDNTSLRFTYARGVAFPNISTVAFGNIDPNYYLRPYGGIPVYDPLAQGTNCGIAGYTVPCQNFGEQLYWVNQNADGIPFQPVKPMTSSNWQLTISHLFTKGRLQGVAMSVAPWYRHQYDTTAQVASPLIGANGLPVVLQGTLQTLPAVFTNGAQEFATGVDLNITKENPVGLSGQLTATYTNEFSSVIPLSTSEDFYPNIPTASLLAGNLYRVGFVSPLSATLALTYKTKSGWRVNPRYSYNIGYPTGLGTMTAAFVNGVAVNVPNTNAVVGSAPNGPSYYVDPLNPGAVTSPNIVASRGFGETSQPGGKLTPQNSYVDVTIEYTHPNSKLTYGLNLGNVFNQTFGGAVFNGRYQPIATGISGPLTGYSPNSIDYTNYPTAFPLYGSYMNGHGVFVDTPINPGRTFYFYVQTKI